MDLCAEMLAAQLTNAKRLAPHFWKAFLRIPAVGNRGFAFNAVRLLNRFLLYPRSLKRLHGSFDFFHIVDHSYAQLVHAIPPGRAGVFCHDLDAFRSLVTPADEPRPPWFRALSRRILSGLQKAAVVFHSTRVVGDEITRLGLVDQSRLVLAPYGVSAEFTPAGPTNTGHGRYLLHVGSNVPRKRIDVLLRVFASVRSAYPELRLVKVGEKFSHVQEAIIEQLNLKDAISRHEGLSRTEIASLYRGALAVLMPSEAEGFGLPVIEALACGALVLASDLPVLREVGGSAAEYFPVGNIDAWVAGVKLVIEKPNERPPSLTRLNQAARFSWNRHAGIIRDAYDRLAVSCGLTA